MGFLKTRYEMFGIMILANRLWGLIVGILWFLQLVIGETLCATVTGCR